MSGPKNYYDIEAENRIAGVVKGHMWRVLYFLLGLLMLSVIANGLLFYAVAYKYPTKTFLWTSDAKSVCAAVPLTEPNISAALVKDFGNKAALSLNSYDYINWRRSLSATLDNYFTPSGRSEYSQAFSDSGILQKVRQNYYVVTAVTEDEPVITGEGVEFGRYTWTVEVPLKIYYRVSRETVLPENRILTFKIIRIDPSPLNPNGIGINGVISKQAVRDRDNL